MPWMRLLKHAVRARVSETLEALEKADSARLDGPLQRSLASNAGDGTARDAIVFDKVRRASRRVWVWGSSLGCLMFTVRETWS